MMELTKLHMSSLRVSETYVDNSRSFKVPRVVSSSHDTRDSVNQSQLNQIDSKEGSTSVRSKRSTSVVVEQIRKMYNVVHRDAVDDDITDFFMENGISFNATRSPYYKEMVRKIITAGPGYTPPRYNKMRTSLLDKGVTRM